MTTPHGIPGQECAGPAGVGLGRRNPGALRPRPLPGGPPGLVLFIILLLTSCAPEAQPVEDLWVLADRSEAPLKARYLFQAAEASYVQGLNTEGVFQDQAFEKAAQALVRMIELGEGPVGLARANLRLLWKNLPPEEEDFFAAPEDEEDLSDQVMARTEEQKLLEDILERDRSQQMKKNDAVSAVPPQEDF